LGAALMISSYITAKRNGYEGTGEIPSFKDVLKALNEAKLALLIPVIILGGIYGGFFSPTESAGVASTFAMLIGVFVYQALDFTAVYKIFSQAALTNPATVIIIASSISFAFLMTKERIPVIVADFIVRVSANPLVIILIINIFLLI